MLRPTAAWTCALAALLALQAEPVQASESPPSRIAATNSCRDNNPAMADFTALQCVPQPGATVQREPAGAATPRPAKPRKAKRKKS